MLEKAEFKGSFQGTEKALPHQRYQTREDGEALWEQRKGEQEGGGQGQTTKRTSDRRAKVSLS